MTAVDNSKLVDIVLKQKYRFTDREVVDWHFKIKGKSHGKSELAYLRRSVDKNIYICDSDDDVYMVQAGKCALLGTEANLASQAALNVQGNPTSDGEAFAATYTFPCRRWDSKQNIWSRLKVPTITIPISYVTTNDPAKLDLSFIQSLPPMMVKTRPDPKYFDFGLPEVDKNSFL